MSVEEERADQEFGALAGCFVEGDPEQRRRERRVKRRALALSIVLQAAALAAVILLPLFGKGERLAMAVATPIPPYSPYAAHQPRTAPTHNQAQQNMCHFCFSRIPTGIITRDPGPPGSSTQPAPDLDGLPGLGTPGSIPIVDTRRGPAPPPPPNDTPRIVHVTHLDPALLIHRVEPVYPALARQTRREGRVELHAIIATDGSIQSLQVISGDVIFYQSAKDAVSQWRYKPTYLNGQPVQIDTTITVIYTLGH